jgi:hypothetical protein
VALHHVIPVFNDPNYVEEPLSRWGQEMVDRLRKDEQKRDFFNVVADWAIYQFQSLNEVTNAVRMRLYTQGIERFRGRASPEVIRTIIDATILQERCRQQEVAAHRAKEAREKAARSAKRTAMVS